MVVLWNKNIKEIVGVIVSDKMDKTRVVRVSVIKVNKLYNKRYTEYKKYVAHDKDNSFKEWDSVTIRPIKPMSKTKRRSIVA